MTSIILQLEKESVLAKVYTILYTVQINATLGLAWGHVTSRQSATFKNSIYV